MDRRDFLKSLVLASCVGIMGIPHVGSTSEEVAARENVSSEVPMLPWGYKEIDPDEALKRAHLAYFASE